MQAHGSTCREKSLPVQQPCREAPVTVQWSQRPQRSHGRSQFSSRDLGGFDGAAELPNLSLPQRQGDDTPVTRRLRHPRRPLAGASDALPTRSSSAWPAGASSSRVVRSVAPALALSGPAGAQRFSRNPLLTSAVSPAHTCSRAHGRTVRIREGLGQEGPCVFSSMSRWLPP